MSYAEFLATKKRAAPTLGRDVSEDAMYPMLHPWQRRVVTWAVRRGRAALWEDTGLGKAQPFDEPVLTPKGWCPIGSLGVGDEVISADGYPTRVTGVYPQGERPIVTVKFNDGAAVRCDEDHLWTVATDLDLSRGVAWRIRTTAQLVMQGIADPSGRHRWRIPVVRPVDHPAAELAIDPYVLGVLLGDGTLIQPRGPRFTSVDPEIAAEVKSRLPLGLRLTALPVHSGRAPIYAIALDGAPGWHNRNPYLAALRASGLSGHSSHEKFIPAEYLTASIAQRLDLLRGLMDTDGYVAADGTVQFGSSSPTLANDVLAIVRSLGGVARRSVKIPTYTHKGERRRGREHHTLTIALPDGTIPFLLSRKVSRCADRYYVPQRKIVSVTPDGIADCVCIAVAHPSQLYVTADYIVTHNTIQSVQWATLSADRSLIIAPLSVCLTTTIQEAAKVGVTARYARSDADAEGPGVWVTNYEMATRFDPARLGAVVLDEASILKQADGKTRTALIRHFAPVPRRLAATATPMPNDIEELTSQAEFLGVATRTEMLAAYFVHDDEGWRLKGHARKPMFRWMASWAVALSRPSDIGGSDEGYILPGLDIIPHLLDVDVVPEGQLFATDLGGVGGRAKIRRATLDARCEVAAKLVMDEPDEPWLLWAGLNAEADRLADLIPGAVNVEGSWTPEAKADAFLQFMNGSIRYLITKPSIGSLGLNFQHCARTAFVGLSDSYQDYYQAIRRFYRYGQARRVQAHIILSELEGKIAGNVARKERQAADVTRELVREMREAGELRIR